ncbi:putative Signal peptide protein [uncultured Gammaproteobacteria bacterium]
MKFMLRSAAFSLLAATMISGFGAGAGAATATPAVTPIATYANEAEAARACPKDVVVWANKDSHVLHGKESRWFGKTKSGTFACKEEAVRAGYRLVKKD